MARAGFQSHSPERRREIAASGGKAAHVKGTPHRWTSEEAKAAGRKGGGRRVPKGFAEMDADDHVEVSRTGGSRPRKESSHG
jgi:general stress protein YciG